MIWVYHNDPKFSDRQVWANSADPDQTAHQGLHCLQFRLHLSVELHCSNFRVITTIFWMSEYLGHLRYIVCPDLSVRKLRIIMVVVSGNSQLLKNGNPVSSVVVRIFHCKQSRP